MAKTVAEGFQEFLRRLAPSPTEVEKRKSHRKTIEQAMLAEFPGFNKVIVIGSHTRDSAVHLFSDVDYLAKLGVDDVTRAGSRISSTTILNRTKTALLARFSATDVWIDGPAVVVGFGQGAGAVDVVPGVWVGPTSTSPQYPVFDIPDGAGGWQQSSPERHTKYLRDEDDRAGSKLASTIRLLKGWKYARTPSVPVLGFHLELLLAMQGTCVGARSYQNCLLDAFRLIRDRKGSALNDPLSISGRIPATRTEAQRDGLLSAAAHAAEKAARAIEAEIAGEIADAYSYWGLVFNGEFPAR